MNNNEWEIDNLPNRLTIFRVILIPVIVFCLFSEQMRFEWAHNKTLLLNYIAAIVFIIASITDFFDGYIARKKNIVTVFGSFLDPIADKFLVISALIMLLALNRVNALVVLVLILREMYITALRLLAMEKGISVPVGTLGKWKTATQMVGIPMMMINHTLLGIDLALMGNIALYISTIFSLYSSVEYSFGLVKKIQKLRITKKREKKQDNTTQQDQV